MEERALSLGARLTVNSSPDSRHRNRVEFSRSGRICRQLRSNKSVANRVTDQFSDRLESEFPHCGGPVSLDGLDADMKSCLDLFVRFSFGEHSNDFAFADGHSVSFVRFCSCFDHVVQHVSAALVLKYGVCFAIVATASIRMSSVSVLRTWPRTPALKASARKYSSSWIDRTGFQLKADFVLFAVLLRCR